MSKKLCLFQEVFKAVGPIRFLKRSRGVNKVSNEIYSVHCIYFMCKVLRFSDLKKGVHVKHLDLHL